jgi:hypothetical protein
MFLSGLNTNDSRLFEAVAIEAWPKSGQAREIYSDDDQFFRAIIERVVEVNRIENPFPDLCVVRSLVMTHDLGFRIGTRLARYIADHGPTIPQDDLERIQEKHYGNVRVPGTQLHGWIRSICASLDVGTEQHLRLPDNTEPPSRSRTTPPLIGP